MSDERVPADVQSLWQGQPASGGTMSLDELRQRSRRLTRIVSRRNLREHVAGALAVSPAAAGALAPREPRSAPVQKCRPLPRNTTTRTSLSAPRAANCSFSSSSIV